MKFSIKKSIYPPKSIYPLAASAFLAAMLAVSVPAQAQKRQSGARDAGRISWVELVQKLEGDGYRIREIEMKRNGWQADVIRDGNRYELRLDTRGNILRKKWDD